MVIPHKSILEFYSITLSFLDPNMYFSIYKLSHFLDRKDSYCGCIIKKRNHKFSINLSIFNKSFLNHGSNIEYTS